MKIRAAAIKQDGVIYIGRRHSEIVSFINSTIGTRPVNGEQGFITDENEFVNRKRAGRIAFEATQIQRLRWPSEGLFSEELDLPEFDSGPLETKMSEPDIIQEITSQVGKEFRTFGGGKESNWNPIAAALKDQPLQFAAGVDVAQVVGFVLLAYEKCLLKEAQALPLEATLESPN